MTEGRRPRRGASLDGRLEIVQGDITTLDVEAVVNAANSSLLGGGGVDGAIHRAAGPGLREECKALGGCRTGEAKVTGGHGLPARFVIHTVGPVWRGGRAGEERLLASCYRSCLESACGRGIQSVAFPAISTGIFGFPMEEACRIALREVRSFLAIHDVPRQVLLVCFGRSDYETCLAAASEG